MSPNQDLQMIFLTFQGNHMIWLDSWSLVQNHIYVKTNETLDYMSQGLSSSLGSTSKDIEYLRYIMLKRLITFQ